MRTFTIEYVEGFPDTFEVERMLIDPGGVTLNGAKTFLDGVETYPLIAYIPNHRIAKITEDYRVQDAPPPQSVRSVEVLQGDPEYYDRRGRPIIRYDD